MRPGVTSRMRKTQVCPCLTLCTAPTCSCVFVCVVLSKKKRRRKKGTEKKNDKKTAIVSAVQTLVALLGWPHVRHVITPVALPPWQPATGYQGPDYRNQECNKCLTLPLQLWQANDNLEDHPDHPERPEQGDGTSHQNHAQRGEPCEVWRHDACRTFDAGDSRNVVLRAGTLNCRSKGGQGQIQGRRIGVGGCVRPRHPSRGAGEVLHKRRQQTIHLRRNGSTEKGAGRSNSGNNAGNVEPARCTYAKHGRGSPPPATRPRQPTPHDAHRTAHVMQRTPHTTHHTTHATGRTPNRASYTPTPAHPYPNPPLPQPISTPTHPCTNPFLTQPTYLLPKIQSFKDR